VSLRRLLLLAAFTPLLAAAAPAEPTRGPRRPKIAVMEIKALYGDAQVEALLSEVALTEAASFRGLDTIGRSDIQSMLGLERQRQLLGCTEDASCYAEIGGALGVDYLLVGSVGKIGALVRLDLKLVDGNRARVVGRVGTSLDARMEGLVEAVQNGVRALLHQVSPADPVARPTGPARWPAWVAIGTGAAALAGGVTAAVMASSQYKELKASQGQVGFAGSYDTKSARIRKLSVLADVLIPVGAVTLGVGGWLWWRSRPPAALKVQVAAGPDGGRLLLSGSF
jgi:TolB-like protein